MTARAHRGPEFAAPLDCTGRLLAAGDTVEATGMVGCGIRAGTRGRVLEVRPRLDCESGAASEPIPNGVRVELSPRHRTVSAAFIWRKVLVN